MAVCFYSGVSQLAGIVAEASSCAPKLMKKITALVVQKRNPNRVNIHLDGEYSFGVARIVAAWLKVGAELDEKKIEQLQV